MKCCYIMVKKKKKKKTHAHLTARDSTANDKAHPVVRSLIDAYFASYTRLWENYEPPPLNKECANAELVCSMLYTKT